jgi:hypothetical protein
MPSPATSSRKRTAFVLLVVACALVAAVAIALGARASAPASGSTAAARDALASAEAEHREMVLYRSGTRPDGPVALAPVGSTAGRPTVSGLDCARVYYASGRGVCVARRDGFAAGYDVEVFNADLAVRHTIPVDGIPSRARVSPDGRYGAVTLFVSGHAYAAPGTFSTQTALIDLASGRRIANLEDFTVTRGGKQVTAVDVNYWGVTFARDSDRFYATLATGGRTYLIQGSVSARSAHVLHTNVECPSLSPDGTRVAFKRRTGSSTRPWRLTVLNLRTMRETPLAETRSVDDQAEWLDDRHVLYGLDGQVWTVPADGSGAPRRFIGRAESPAVVRF